MIKAGVLLLAGASLLPAATSCVTPDSIWSMETLADPHPQPNGRLVAFLRSRNDVLDDKAYSELRLVSLDGTGARALTTDKEHASRPAWSRDGKYLAYVSDRDGKPRIYVREIPSDIEKDIEPGVAGSPSNLSWSPDGKTLAFTAFVSSPPSWSPSMAAKPEGAHWAAPAVSIANLRWTLDGTGLLEPGGVHVFTIAATGGTPRQISREPFFHTSYVAEPEFTWAPDGRSIIAPAVKGKDGWAVYDGNQIYSFPLDGGEPQQLTTGTGHKGQVRVSPDGTRLAYSGYEWLGHTYHVSHLYLMNLGDRSTKVVTKSWDRDVALPVWSSDSEHVYFLSDDQGSTNVHRFDVSGQLTQITSGKQRLGSLGISGDSLVFTYNTPSVPTQISKMSLRGKAIEPLARPKNWPCSLSDAEEVWFSSFDNKRVQGWLMKPKGFDPAVKYPLVVSIHGGPHGAYGANFSDEFQMLAARGYAVLYMNPRGSTGYGEEFGNIIQHKWPGDDIRDILAGVDYVAKAGYIDPARVGVVGGSGGGLMTSWIITQTDRFRAAVALYPVTNWFTHVGSADNGFYIGSVYRKGMPWDYPEDYITHSPLFYAKKVKTPTMIITGDEDWRTPVAQSQEFFRALKVLGVESVFVRVPGEGHGIRKFPSHRVQVMTHTLAWLDRYLR